MAKPVTLSSADLPCGIWIALDMEDFIEAIALVKLIGHIIDGVKVHASSEDDFKRKTKLLREVGAKKIWWDRKAHDTASTVKAIAKTAVACGADRLTVHASAGIEAMMAAVKHGPKDIVAITMLTSLSKAEIGIQTGMPVDAAVLQRARDAALAGVSHVVCSCQEVGMLNDRRRTSRVADRPLELSGLKLIVPGSRTITDDMGSQKRSTSAPEAVGDGSDDLVLGSEIWRAEDPSKALQQVYRAIIGKTA